MVSEDEDVMVPFEALDYLDESLSKGSSLKRLSYSLSLQTNNNKKSKLHPKKKKLAAYLQAQLWKLNQELTQYYEK